MADILGAIDAAYEAKTRYESRTIGSSVIGHECDAHLALTLRSFPGNPIPARVLRIFELGHKLEDMVIADIKAAGVDVQDRDPLTGKQYTYTDYGGHVKAKLDGHVEDDERSGLGCIEIKSMNDKTFDDFVKKGLRAAFPKYYAQAIMLMGLSSTKWCRIIAYNKNTSAYHEEVVEFDPFMYSFQKHRIEMVLRNEAARASKNPESFMCRFCSKSEACWGKRLPEPACQNCAFAIADGTNGGWWCQKWSKEANAVCSEYEVYRPAEKVA